MDRSEHSPFLINARLLPIVDKAELGNLESVLLLSHAYQNGWEVPVDNDRSLYYSLILAENCPKLIPWYRQEGIYLCYASLFSKISYLYATKNDYRNSLKWLKKSLNYAKNIHKTEVGGSFLERHEVNERIADLKKLVLQQRISSVITWFEGLYINLFWNKYTRQLRKG